jgi:hypothetical protein
MAPVTGWADSPVAESDMERYCAGEASAELGTRPTNISTDRWQKRGSDYVVTGQTPQSGYNITTFECVYGKRGMWKGFRVTGRNVNPGGGSGGGSHDSPVAESDMERYCAGEASAELGTRLTNISTDRWQKRGSNYVVTGQTPQSGHNVTRFECVYGKRGMWKGFKVTSRGQDGGYNSSNGSGYGSDTIPNSAKARCLDMFGERANVRSISALRPGYWEVLMDSKSGSRSVNCTIKSDGEIQEWIELN